MQTREIRAAVLRKTNSPLEIETLEMEGPREDEALVRIVASGICHTDSVSVQENTNLQAPNLK